MNALCALLVSVKGNQLMKALLSGRMKGVTQVTPKTTMTSRTRHCPALRLWLGAQTADTDCDWPKQVERFTAVLSS